MHAYPGFSETGSSSNLSERTPKTSSSTTQRSPYPTYRHVTGLWQRTMVVLSGAAAKRKRACARLNTFAAPLEEQEATKTNTYAQWKAKDIAVRKFISTFRSSKESDQQKMRDMLTPDANTALQEWHTAHGWDYRIPLDPLTCFCLSEM